MTKFSAWLGVGLLAGLTSACAHPQASATTIVPLEVPLPPARLVQADSVKAPLTVEAPAPIPSSTDELRAAAQPSAQPAAKPADPPKPELAASEIRPPDETRPAPSPLQTTPPQRESEMEAAIKAVLSRAEGTLKRVDYRLLSADARAQYDMANNFRRQADDELKAKNMLLAKTLADKADTIATQLAP